MMLKQKLLSYFIRKQIIEDSTYWNKSGKIRVCLSCSAFPLNSCMVFLWPLSEDRFLTHAIIEI